MKLLLPFAFLAGVCAVSALTNNADPPVELGAVKWERDLDAAKQKSADSGKPVLVLFQEVPGWSTCQDFGNGPLSLPLLVESIEEDFIPVLVYNNKEEDAELLKSFEEPSWNNPVVRFLNSDGKDLIPRKDGVWEIAPLAARMAASLEAAKRDVPEFLDYVADGWQDKYRRASFAMAWYWVGEAQLGSLEGVYSTRSVWVGEKEVVHVTYDPQVISYETLLRNADEMECTIAVYTHHDDQNQLAKSAGIEEVVSWDDSLETRHVKKSEQKYYLRNTILGHLPLTELQAMKMNAVLGGKLKGKEATEYLSPRQIELLARIRSAIEKDDKTLAEFGFPEDQANLIAYHGKLLIRLEDLED